MDEEKFICHKSLYKSPRGRALPWKDIYRKRCFERFRASRDGMLEHFRISCDLDKSLLLASKDEIKKLNSPGKFVQDIMEEEWSVINRNRRFPSLNHDLSCLNASSDEDSDEDIAKELREIQIELLSEEESLLNEFLQFESASLQSQIKMFQNEDVICPICQVRTLREGKQKLPFQSNNCNTYQTPPKSLIQNESEVTTLRCDCGLSLYGPGLSLRSVKCALQQTINLHEKNCLSPLIFTAKSDSTNILIKCTSCDWMSYLK